jgi:hypothetical protein
MFSGPSPPGVSGPEDLKIAGVGRLFIVKVATKA